MASESMSSVVSEWINLEWSSLSLLLFTNSLLCYIILHNHLLSNELLKRISIYLLTLISFMLLLLQSITDLNASFISILSSASDGISKSNTINMNTIHCYLAYPFKIVLSFEWSQRRKISSINQYQSYSSLSIHSIQ